MPSTLLAKVEDIELTFSMETKKYFDSLGTRCIASSGIRIKLRKEGKRDWY